MYGVVSALKEQSGFKWDEKRGADIDKDSESVWDAYVLVHGLPGFPHRSIIFNTDVCHFRSTPRQPIFEAMVGSTLRPFKASHHLTQGAQMSFIQDMKSVARLMVIARTPHLYLMKRMALMMMTTSPFLGKQFVTLLVNTDTG